MALKSIVSNHLLVNNEEHGRTSEGTSAIFYLKRREFLNQTQCFLEYNEVEEGFVGPWIEVWAGTLYVYKENSYPKYLFW